MTILTVLALGFAHVLVGWLGVLSLVLMYRAWRIGQGQGLRRGIDQERVAHLRERADALIAHPNRTLSVASTPWIGAARPLKPAGESEKGWVNVEWGVLPNGVGVTGVRGQISVEDARNFIERLTKATDDAEFGFYDGTRRTAWARLTGDHDA